MTNNEMIKEVFTMKNMDTMEKQKVIQAVLSKNEDVLELFAMNGLSSVEKEAVLKSLFAEEVVREKSYDEMNDQEKHDMIVDKARKQAKATKDRLAEYERSSYEQEQAKLTAMNEAREKEKREAELKKLNDELNEDRENMINILLQFKNHLGADVYEKSVLDEMDNLQVQKLFNSVEIHAPRTVASAIEKLGLTDWYNERVGLESNEEKSVESVELSEPSVEPVNIDKDNSESQSADYDWSYDNAVAGETNNVSNAAAEVVSDSAEVKEEKSLDFTDEFKANLMTKNDISELTPTEKSFVRSYLGLTDDMDLDNTHLVITKDLVLTGDKKETVEPSNEPVSDDSVSEEEAKAIFEDHTAPEKPKRATALVNKADKFKNMIKSEKAKKFLKGLAIGGAVVAAVITGGAILGVSPVVVATAGVAGYGINEFNKGKKL